MMLVSPLPLMKQCGLSVKLLFAIDFRQKVVIKRSITLSPPDGPYGSMTNTVKNNFSRGKVKNTVNFLMAVLHNSLRFHLIYLTMLPPEKHRFIGNFNS